MVKDHTTWHPYVTKSVLIELIEHLPNPLNMYPFFAKKKFKSYISRECSLVQSYFWLLKLRRNTGVIWFFFQISAGQEKNILQTNEASNTGVWVTCLDTALLS